MGHLSYRGDHRDRDPRCARAGRALPRPRGRGLSLRLRRPRQRGGRRGRHADDLRQRPARARAGREAAQAHELADHDRPQPDSAALPAAAVEAARGRARPRHRLLRGRRRRAVDRRSRPRAPADPAHPARGARPPRAGRALLQGDRLDPRRLADRARDADLPRPALARRGARESRHVRPRGARAVAADRRPAGPEGAQAARRASGRVPELRASRGGRDEAPSRLQGARDPAVAALADALQGRAERVRGGRALRDRRRCGGRRWRGRWWRRGEDRRLRSSR